MMEAHTPEVEKTGIKEKEGGREGGKEGRKEGGREGRGEKEKELLLTENHGRVDLAVSVSGAVADTLLLEVIRSHGNHHRLLLQSINVLHHTPSH